MAGGATGNSHPRQPRASNNPGSETAAAAQNNGAGIGAVAPTTASGATASLPPERFATGSAVLMMVRQIGGVIGGVIVVVLLVAVAGTVDQLNPMKSAHRGRYLMIAVVAIAAEAVAAVASLVVGRVEVHGDAVATGDPALVIAHELLPRQSTVGDAGKGCENAHRFAAL